MRKYLVRTLKILGGLFGLLFLAFILLPSYCDSTPRAKISEALLESASVMTTLSEHCAAGTLVAGMSHESLGIPDLYQPGRYTEKLVVRVESPQRALVINTLKDINSDFSILWSTRAIAAGAILETEIQCNDGVPFRAPGKGTTVPVKYLPSSLRPRGEST